MLLGDRSELTGDLRRVFVDTGTAHLIAISGLHLGLVAWAAYRLLLWMLVRLSWPGPTGNPATWAAAGTMGMVWLYVGQIVTSSATIRAALVITVVAVGRISGRLNPPERTLLLAGLAIVLFDTQLMWRPGTLLSFAAASAIIAVLPWLQATLAKYRDLGLVQAGPWFSALSYLLGLATVGFVAWAATTPIALAFFGNFTPIGLVVNLAVVPLMGFVVLPIGFLWGSMATLYPQGAIETLEIPAYAMGLLLDCVHQWAQWVGSSHCAAWHHWLGLLCAVLVVMCIHKARIHLAIALIGTTAVAFFLANQAPGELRVTFLDVGHGDATLVSMPEGQHILVDTGGASGGRPDGKRVNEYLADGVLVPAMARLGVNHLNLMVITHVDGDHLGAAKHLVTRVGLDELWIPACGHRNRDLQTLVARVVAAGGRVKMVHESPPFDWGGATLEVLWPPADIRRPQGTCKMSLNDSAMVMTISYANTRILLPADIEHRAETQLLSHRPERLKADLLKVPHHGSRTSSTEDFLDAVAPRWAVISGAIGPGRKMPPHGSIIQRLLKRRIRNRVTGRDGAVSATISANGELKVKSGPHGQGAWHLP